SSEDLDAERHTDGRHNAAPLYDDAVHLLKQLPANDIDLGLKSATSVLDEKASSHDKEQAHFYLLRFGP
ncbi:hypothetical protein AAEQ92_07400, partial [Pseudomonas aeruginosa]